MKIHGKTISGPNSELIVFPRPDQDVVFKAQAVLDYDEFNGKVAPPTPPNKILPGGVTVPDLSNVKYLEALDSHNTKRTNWMILKSLSVTPGLTWDTVTDDPETWDNFKQELKDSGFSISEINRIIQGVLNANGLNEEKMEEARKRFLASQAEQVAQ